VAERLCTRLQTSFSFSKKEKLSSQKKNLFVEKRDKSFVLKLFSLLGNLPFSLSQREKGGQGPGEADSTSAPRFFPLMPH